MGRKISRQWRTAEVTIAQALLDVATRMIELISRNPALPEVASLPEFAVDDSPSVIVALELDLGMVLNASENGMAPVARRGLRVAI
jgi:hypothetical protein